MISPAHFMNPGHKSPSSKDRTVPETAPMAKRMAVPVAQRLANAKETASLVRSQRHSASAIMKGMATPIDAKIMWKANDMAICERAASRSVMAFFGRQQRPKDLGNAPCLCDAASRGIARLGVEDLADAADPGVPQFIFEPTQHLPRLCLVRIHPLPSIEKVSDEPGPHRALVVCRVSRSQITEICPLVVPMPR